MANPSLFPGINVLARYFSPIWWRHTWAFTWQFRRQLVTPSIIFFVTSLMATYVLKTLQELNVPPGDQPIDAGILLPKLLTAMAGMSLGGILFLVALSILLFRLTTFARSFLLLPLPSGAADQQSPNYRASIIEALTQAEVDLKTHKAYLAKVLLISLLIASPVIFFFTATGFWAMILSTPMPESASSIKIPPDIRRYTFVAQAAAALSFIIISNYSVVSMAVACMFNRTIGKATSHALLLTITSAPLMTLICVITAVSSTAISTPYVACTWFGTVPDWLTPGTIWQQLGWETWQVISGFVVYPVCTAMLFEVVRDSLANDTASETPISPPTIENPPAIDA